MKRKQKKRKKVKNQENDVQLMMGDVFIIVWYIYNKTTSACRKQTVCFMYAIYKKYTYLKLFHFISQFKQPK
jgi:hypothetical protein